MTTWIIYTDFVTTPRRDQPEPNTPRGRRRAETLREIEQAAIEVMAEDGVAALSLTKVAQRVGVKQPSLYQYVTSRVDLYDALFQVLSHNDIQHWADRFLAALEREPTALSQLEQMPSVES